MIIAFSYAAPVTGICDRQSNIIMADGQWGICSIVNGQVVNRDRESSIVNGEWVVY
jgi:hypothetical protein